MSGYDYYIYRYIISNFILDHKNIYNLEKYKQKQFDRFEEEDHFGVDLPKEFSDTNTKSCNHFFYNIILNLIQLIPKEVMDTNNEFDLFLNGVEKNYFLTHDIQKNQILPNSPTSKKEDHSVEDSHSNTSPTTSMIQKNEDSISQETLIGNESMFLTPSSSCEKLDSQPTTVHNSTDEFDLIEKEELKLHQSLDYYTVCPTSVYVQDAYERIRKCTKIMMSWNDITEEKNDNEVDKFMLLSSEIKTNFCSELIRCLDHFFNYDYEHNILLTGCISRLFYLINDEFHRKLFRKEDHTPSLFLQILKKLSDHAIRVSHNIENFTKKLKYIKQEIFFDQIYESILTKSFYASSASFKDYTKLLNISYEENQFLFSYILLQEFIKEIISVEMAFIMFDDEPKSSTRSTRSTFSPLHYLQKEGVSTPTPTSAVKEHGSDCNSPEANSAMATLEVLNLIDQTLAQSGLPKDNEKEFEEVQAEIKKLHLDQAFFEALEKEEATEAGKRSEEEGKEDHQGEGDDNVEGKEGETWSDGVMKTIEDTNEVIMKSIQQNFSKQYSLELDALKEGIPSPQASPTNATTLTADTSAMSYSLDLFGNVSHDSLALSTTVGVHDSDALEKSSEFNLTQEIKKLNALFNQGQISDIVDPFEYDSYLLETSMTTPTTNPSDLSYLLNLRKNSSGSFLYDGDAAGAYEAAFTEGRQRKSSPFLKEEEEEEDRMKNELQEEDFNPMATLSLPEEPMTLPYLSHSNGPIKRTPLPEKEIQIPSLVSESNGEYYKYLKDLPSSPVLPPTLLKPNPEDHSSSTSGSLIDPMEDEDDLAYLEYLEKLSREEKTKRKEEFHSKGKSQKPKEREKGQDQRVKERPEKEEDELSQYERVAELEDELERESEEIISCSSPTVATVHSMDIHDLDEEEEEEEKEEKDPEAIEEDLERTSMEQEEGKPEGHSPSKNKKKLKSRINNNVEKFFSHQKQKINSIFGKSHTTIEPEAFDPDQDKSTYLSVKKEDSNLCDSSYTEFYSETFDETSFLKKNLNPGFGYL